MEGIYLEANRYVVSMVRSVFEGREPDRKPEHIPLGLIFQIAKYQCLEVILYDSAGKISNGSQADRDVLAVWRKRMTHMSMQGRIQFSEKEALCDSFSEAGIWFLPLKGCIMKELYPDPDWRQMSDVDILIREEDAAAVRDILTARGYECASFGFGKDDIYNKRPWVHMEIHRTLVNDASDNYSKYDDIWTRAVASEENPCLYSMTAEDFYLYMIEHFCRHFHGGGSGVRSVMDMYVFRRDQEDGFDWEYIGRKLREHGLDGFEKKVAAIMRRWFCGEDVEIDDETEDVLFDTGYYGTMSHQYRQDMRRMQEKHHSVEGAQLAYMIEKLFPSRKCLLNNIRYKELVRFPFLLPYSWLKRVVRVLFHDHERIRREITYYRQYKADAKRKG